MDSVTNGVNGLGMAATTNDDYDIVDQPHSKLHKMRIIYVGAGAGGLLAAYKMKMQLQNYEMVCYEKNPSVGGTWYENRYPGCACDVPGHAYTYPFEGNPDWSSFYASSDEIHKYFVGFYEKHGLQSYIKLQHKVVSAAWDEQEAVYRVDVEKADGSMVHDWCHVLVNGTGFLNKWRWPDIPGLHDFGGSLLHSANWDRSVDWAGKKVAVIGTGSSSIQIVPQIQRTAAHLTAFMRSVTWISPPGFSAAIREKHVPESKENQYFYTEADKERFRNDPEGLLMYRRYLEQLFTSRFGMFYKDSDESEKARKLMTAEMNRRIGEGHDELKARLIPSWAPGCRRLTPGDGYLEALVQPNVTTVHQNIKQVTREGLITEDGVLHKVDILVCATGFDVSFIPPYSLQGRDGVQVKDEWKDNPNVYLSIAAPKFPNYFTMCGSRGSVGQGCVLPAVCAFWFYFTFANGSQA